MLVALVLVSVAQFLIALDYSIVYLALPSIEGSLRIAPALVQWVVSAYGVLFAGFLVAGGRLTDRFGPVRMFVIAVSLFGLASGAGAAAGNGGVLVAARAVQGLGAALLQPAVLGLIGTSFPAGPARSRALAVWVAVGAGGLAVGALLGGLLTAASWRLTLLVNVPPALLCALAGARWLAGGGTATGAGPAGRIPVTGAVLGTGSVLTAVLFLTLGGEEGWTAPVTLGCLALAVAFTACFFMNERSAGSVLIDRALRGDRSVRTGAAAAALYMASVGSEFYLLTLLLQQADHYSPLRAGLAFLPLAVMVTAGSAAGGRAVSRIGAPAVLTAGFLVAAAGLLWLAAGLHSGNYLASLLPGLLLSGFGHGAIYTATFIIGGRDVPAGAQGTAGALLTTAQYLSGAVVLAGLTLVLGRWPGFSGFTTAFVLLAAAAAAGSLLGLRRLSVSRLSVPRLAVSRLASRAAPPAAPVARDGCDGCPELPA